MISDLPELFQPAVNKTTGVFRAPPTRGRLSATAISELNPRRDFSLIATADNAPISISYGKGPVEGDIFAIGDISGDLVIGVAWGYGEWESIDSTFINGEAPPAGATVTNYTGTIFQTTDATLASAISGWANPMILTTPQGSVGIAYSVFRIPPSELTGAPRFSCIGTTLKVNDSRPSKDTLYSDVGLWVVFDKAAPTDRSSPAKTVTLGTGVFVDEDYAKNQFTNQGVSFSGSFAFGAQDFCIEAKLRVVDPFASGIVDIYRGDYSGGNDALTLRVNGDKIEVVVRDGPTIVIYEVAAATIPSSFTEFDVKLTRESGTFYLYLNGVETWSDSTAAAIPTTSSSNRTCYSESSPPRLAQVRSLRITVGNPRYTDDHDPRGIPFSDCRRYSDNTALCFADLSTNRIYGMGARTRGIEDCAEWNDANLPSSVPRARIAISFNQPVKTQSLLDLLATYGELYWYWEGADVYMEPDSLVDLDDAPQETGCILNTLTVEGIDDTDTPNRIFTRYTVVGPGPVWSTDLAEASLPGVDEDEVEAVESTLSMPGIFRVEEAENKALSRVYQMQNRVRVSWVSTDRGITRRKGDVVRITVPGRGADLYVRVLSADIISYGRYQISGMRYSILQYPSQIDPGAVGSIPVGAILPLSGDTVPSGWEAWNDANGRYLIGAGGTYVSGATGGSSTFAGFVGVTSTDSSHSVESYDPFLALDSSTGTEFPFNITPQDAVDTDHNHTYATGTITPDPLRRQQRFVKKMGSASATIPRSVQIFGRADLALAGLSRIVSSANRLLVASASSSNAGQLEQFVSITTGETDDTHFHGESTPLGAATPGPNTVYSATISGGGLHDHDYTLTISTDLRRRYIPLWGAAGDYPLIPGMMILWENIASLPAGWRLCDGSFGTPDYRDHFIPIAGVGNEFAAEGDNAILADGIGSPVFHDHQGPGILQDDVPEDYVHRNSIPHTHTIDASSSWMPPYYAVGVLMYLP